MHLTELTPAQSTGIAVVAALVYLVVIVVFYVWTALALSRVFAKLGEPAWKGWVPVVNVITLYTAGGFSALWVISLFFPIVQVVGLVVLYFAVHAVNRRFGKGAGYTVLGILVLPVWASILGFGRSQPLDAPADAAAPAAPSPFETRMEGLAPGGFAPMPPSASFAAPAPDPVIYRPVPQSAPVPPIPSGAPVPPLPVAEPAAPLPPAVPVPPVPEPEPAPVVRAPEPAPAAPAAAPAADPWAPPISSIPGFELPATAAVPAAPVPTPEVIVPTPAPTPVVASESALVEAAPVEPAPIEPAPIEPVASEPEPDPDVELDTDETVLKRRGPTWSVELADGRVIALTNALVLLGRNPAAIGDSVGAQLVAIADPSKTMSKTHARLQLGAEGWTITDLGSTNGTAVLGAAGEELELDPGVATSVTAGFTLGQYGVRLRREG